MRQWWSVSLLALALGSPAAAAPPQGPAPSPVGPQPVAVFPSFVHDAGRVIRGETVTHPFVVRNEGDAPLEIQSVHPT